MGDESEYYAYILKSLKDKRYYYGSTSNLDYRLERHNSGQVKSTKSRTPFIIHYYEKYPDRASAQKREYFFKSRSGYRWLQANNLI